MDSPKFSRYVLVWTENFQLEWPSKKVLQVSNKLAWNSFNLKIEEIKVCSESWSWIVWNKETVGHEPTTPLVRDFLLNPNLDHSLPASGFGWQWVFVICTFLGILISQYIERRFQPRIGYILFLCECFPKCMGFVPEAWWNTLRRSFWRTFTFRHLLPRSWPS